MPLKRTPPNSPSPCVTSAASGTVTDAPTTVTESALVGTTAVVSLVKERQRYDSEPNLHLLSLNTKERKKRKFEGEDLGSFMCSIQEMFDTFSIEQNKRFKDLLVSVNCIREQNAELTKSVETMSHMYDQFLSRINTLENERKENKKYIHLLEQRVDTLERKSRSSGIEIRYIPKTKADKPESKSDLCQLVKHMGKSVRVDIGDSDIRDIYRIPNTKDSSSPIITEFTSVLMKEKILSAVKSFNRTKQKGEKLNTGHFNITGPIRPVFIGETLTQKSQKLFYVARAFQKEHGYEFCWTSRGIVYLRLRINCPQIKIEGEDDLEKLRNSK